MLKAIFTSVVCSVALLTTTLSFAQPKTAKPSTKEAMAEQMEREMLIGMVALRDTCKERNPANAARIDANWKTESADMPPQTAAFTQTAEFKTKVAERKKDQAEQAKSADGAKMIEGVCTQLAK